MEEELRKSSGNFYVGHTREYVKVAAECETPVDNQIVEVELTGFRGRICGRNCAENPLLFLRFYIRIRIDEKGRDNMDKNRTQHFSVVKDELDVHRILARVYEALEEKGYNPVNQMVGYIMSGDPTYITSHKNARSMINKVERDEIIEALL